MLQDHDRFVPNGAVEPSVAIREPTILPTWRPTRGGTRLAYATICRPALTPAFTSQVETITVNKQPLILHITGDYPDPTRPPTTHAIKHLIDNLDRCDHVIISLTRTADPRAVFVRELAAAPGQRLFAMHHFGLPLGIGLFASFHRVAAKIEEILAANGIVPNAVHSHRMSFDGLAGWLISRRYQIPHLVSVRGQADRKILRFKPSYRVLLAHILRAAHRIYYVSAWMKPELARVCHIDPARERMLPNIVKNTRRVIQPAVPDRRFAVAVNLDNYSHKLIQESAIQQKGVDRLIRAFAIAVPKLDGITLDIIGVGKRENALPLETLIAQLGLAGRVKLRKPLPNSVYLAELPKLLAFTLPSRNETFGMVYTEALFAGVPILYSRGTGIDGHLDGLDVGIAVPPNDVESIAEALITLARRNDQFRLAIAANAGELFRRFDAQSQVAAYTSDLEAAADPAHQHGAVPA